MRGTARNRVQSQKALLCPAPARPPFEMRVRETCFIVSSSHSHLKVNSEKACEAGHGALLVKGESDLLLHRPDAIDRQVGIQISEQSGELRFERAGGHIGYQQNSADEMGAELKLLHQRILIVDILRQRNIEHWPSGLVEAPASEFRIAHDANDTECASKFGHVQAEVLIERVLVTLEEALHEGLVDERDRRRGFVVRGSKGTST